MLKHLHIENIAVIERADIDLVSGFNALTGETGAGKSIIIDAINAVMGERTSRDLIRSTAQKATVCAIFGELSLESEKIIRENGIEPDEDGNICVQRIINLNGNGVIRINGQAVTAQLLRDISKHLINIHGQHDSQMLLRPENHYIYLDLVADNDKEKEEYNNAFKNFTEIRKQLKELETDEDSKLERIELLKFQINEIESIDLHIGEIDELKKTREIIRNSEKIISNLNECVYMLNGDMECDGAVYMARTAVSLLEKTQAEELNSIASKLSSAVESLDSASNEIRKYITDFSYSKEDAEKTDERLDLLSRIVLKYGGSEEETLKYLEKAKSELELIEFNDNKIVELENMLIRAQQELINAGNNLSDSRIKAAHNFEKMVCESLNFMDMNHVQFTVDIQEAKYSKTGKDKVEFFISANAGENVKPLYKVASGGELSRIMLAIKGIVADKDNVDTLIFDEIDTGISGRVASKVAVELKKLSTLRQVVCVTHLAQIAAAAQGHFLIEKNVRNDKTYTDVVLLEGDKRAEEIARIMSGTELTENIISSANELLDRSKN